MLFPAIALLLLLFLLAALSFYVVQPLFGDARRQDPVAVDPARLASHVRMLAQTFLPRDSSHPVNLDRTAAYIGREFEQAGGRVAEQPYRVAGRTYRNVVALFDPETEERIVVGAHYDAAGPYPGADDNASGIAGLLELAPLLAAANLPLTVELVAYTLEEPPYFGTEGMGSAVHARSLREKGLKVRAMLSLEMIGYFRDDAGSQRFPSRWLSFFYPDRGNFIAVVGRFGQGSLVRRTKKGMVAGTALPVCSITAPHSLPGIDLSDHLSYWQAGYPAVMITDTAFFRNPNYHSPTDNAGSLDYLRMAQVVAGVHTAIRELAR